MSAYRITNPPGRGLPGFGDAVQDDEFCPECERHIEDCECCSECHKEKCECREHDDGN